MLQRVMRKLADPNKNDNTVPNYRDLSQLIPKVQHMISRSPDHAELAFLASVIGRLDERAMLREIFEVAADRGQALVEGGRKGARKRWRAETINRGAWQRKYDELTRLHPRWGRMKLSDATGECFGVSGRTIRNCIPNPKEKAQK